MLASNFFISPVDLWFLIGTGNAPVIVDVRRRDVHDAATGVLPTATWRDAAQAAQWGAELGRTRSRRGRLPGRPSAQPDGSREPARAGF